MNNISAGRDFPNAVLQMDLLKNGATPKIAE